MKAGHYRVFRDQAFTTWLAVTMGQTTAKGLAFDITTCAARALPHSLGNTSLPDIIQSHRAFQVIERAACAR